MKLETRSRTRETTTPLTGAAGAVDQAEGLRKRRGKKRLYMWAAFLLVGTLIGAVWAMGWNTVDVNQTVTSANGDPIFGTGGAGTTGLYANAIDTTGLEDIDIAWKGVWGGITADKTVFKITVPNNAGTYFVDIYNLSANSEFVEDWSALQLEFRIFKVTANGVTTDDVCDATTDFAANDATAVDSTETTPTFTTTAYPTAAAREVLTVDAEDAFISFGGLTGANSVYCVGVSDATPIASNQYGSLIRRPGASEPFSPKFAAVLNRSN